MSEQMSWLFFLFYAGLGKCQQWLLMAAPGWSPRSQWVASSTSPLLHSLHTLYSLFTRCQLPVSIWNAAVPPFSIQGLNKMQKLVVYPQTTPQLFLVHLVIRLGNLWMPPTSHLNSWSIPSAPTALKTTPGSFINIHIYNMATHWVWCVYIPFHYIYVYIIIKLFMIYSGCAVPQQLSPH